jgi:signal transduction histidine kinase
MSVNRPTRAAILGTITPVSTTERPAAAGRAASVAGTAAVVVALAGAGVATAIDQRDHHGAATATAMAVVLGILAVVGLVVTLTAPTNRVGWLLLVGADALGVGAALVDAGVHGITVRPGSVPVATYLPALGSALRAAGFVLVVVVVPTVFPNGRLPGVRWHWVGWCATCSVVALFLGNLLSPTAQLAGLHHWHNPLGVARNAADGLSLLGVLLALVTAGAAVIGLVVRWRRGGSRVRQQLFLFAIACVPPALVLLSIMVTNGAPSWVFAAAVLPMPAAIMFATLGRGLYDLRRAANRTLLWLSMSAFVIALYTLVAVAAAALSSTRHQPWIPALATAIAVTTLLPVQRALQRGVNRVVYGRWHEPYDVLAGLGEQLEAAGDVDRLLDATVIELTTGLELTSVSVRGLNGSRIAGADRSGAVSVPLQAYGDTVGWLHYEPPPRTLSDAEQRLLRDLARHLGGAVHARELREELQRTRERLVLAREEERRRLRRDLHDGLGPTLAGLTLKAATAQATLPPGAADTVRLLQALTEEIRTAATDVRRVIEGLRPPAIDELGLVPAMTRMVDRFGRDAGIVVAVDAPASLPALPAAVEVAAYRIAVEATTNVVRHTDARQITLTLALHGDRMVLTVTDDGSGLTAQSGAGHGVAIMQERADEIGGICTVRNLPDRSGVVVRAELPLPSTGSKGASDRTALHA